jgi:hypothetical protein
MYACIEIKEGIENMKLIHVIYMMKRKSNKRKFFISAQFTIRKISQTNKKMKFNRIENVFFSFIDFIIINTKHPFVFFNQHSSAPCSLYQYPEKRERARPPAR